MCDGYVYVILSMFCIGDGIYTNFIQKKYEKFSPDNLDPAAFCVADTPVSDLEIYILLCR